jgi:type IV pilus assembly protein PilB
MAQLNLGERRIPQDGRLKFTGPSINSEGASFTALESDFHVSTIPTVFGESAVLKVIRNDVLHSNLKSLGLSPAQFDIIKKGISSPNGMILATGPTGSGKTSTLYSALAELSSPYEKFVTVENPVECQLPRFTQIQINPEAGLTYASALQAVLRQDPDVILVGEIADTETAHLTIQAALTGHLVLSTLHTNDAPSTVLRLINLKIDPFLVASALTTVVAQRLIRKICPKCKVQTKVSRTQLARVDLDRDLLKGISFYKGNGCDFCSGTGYKGRIAIFETMDFIDEIKEAIVKQVNPSQLRKIAIENGMSTLRQSALSWVAAGATTLTEALSTTQGTL